MAKKKVDNTRTTIARKIKLTIIGEDEELRQNQYDFIRDSMYAQYKGLNLCMGYLMSNYYKYGADFKNEDFLELKKGLTNTNPIFDGIEFGRGIDSKSLITSKVKQDFDTSIVNGVAKGERSCTNYKKDFPLMTRGRDLKFNLADNGVEVLIKWVNKITFKCLFDKHGNSLELQKTLERVISGEYQVGGSTLCFTNKNELILNLSLSVPIVQKPVLEGRTLGVDCGMAVPAYISIADNIFLRRRIGSYDEFAKVRQHFKKRRFRLQQQLANVKGGKGRAKKLKTLNSLRDKESNFAKTYNHMLSKRIVDFAIQNQCEYINLEKIDSSGLGDKVLGQWGYYQLQQQIEYKAKMNGIKVRYIELAYTSQTCNACGNVDSENRPKKEKGQAYFKCTKCGMRTNADWNASVNIARSTNFVDTSKKKKKKE